MLELNKIYNMDCLDGMKMIDNNSVDMILCDLPYGVTHNKFDKQINLDSLFKSYWKCLKKKGIIVLTSQQPYTTKLISHQLEYFRYDWVWKKGERGSGFLNSHKMPLRNHEEILIFYKELPTYNPQFSKGEPSHKRGKPNKETNRNYGKFNVPKDRNYGTKKFPKSILTFDRPHPPIHPTQKPVELFRYLIKTYSNERDLILDNCMGSGTTAVACKQLNRNFIGFEISKKYCEIARERLQQSNLKNY